MNPTDYRNSVIATACWRAGKGELHAVMLSAALVFLNRSRAQHADVYDEAVRWLEENPGEFPDTRDPEFQQLLNKLESVLSGAVPDKTGGALWFLPKDKLKPETLGPFQITTTIGGLVFIK